MDLILGNLQEDWEGNCNVVLYERQRSNSIVSRGKYCVRHAVLPDCDDSIQWFQFDLGVLENFSLKSAGNFIENTFDEVQMNILTSCSPHTSAANVTNCP